MPRHRRQGISPIIAVLLLILIAIAAGVMVYAFVAGWVGSATSSTTVAQAQLSIDFADAIDAAAPHKDNITVYIRNIGSSTVIIDSIYVAQSSGGEVSWNIVEKGDDASVDYGNSYPELNLQDLTINPGEVIAINITFGTYTLQAGTLYTVRIVAQDGAATVFSVKAHS